MTRPDAHRLASAVYQRFSALYHECHPHAGPLTETNLAALMLSLPELDIDTVKILLRPKSRLAPWIRYASALQALNADDDTVTWFKDIHDKLAELLPVWSPPPRDIAAITDDAEFMDTIRRLRQTTPPMTVAALKRAMGSRDYENTWRYTRLSEILKANTLPSDQRPAHVRNLLETLCDNAGRPITDADHLYETWQRLQRPKTITRPKVHERPDVVVASMTAADPSPEPDIKIQVGPLGPQRPLSKTLLILGVVMIVLVVVTIAVL